jgi:oligopeptide/dipeptide ABC transporter ATP-binding protein
MYLGKIVEIASSDELYVHPRHPYTAALLSAVPVADPQLAKGRDSVGLRGEPPSATMPPAGCRFHPRCPEFVAGTCDVREPALEDKPGGGRAACHFPLPDVSSNPAPR